MKKENKLKFDFGTILLLTGALANVPLWIGAFTLTSSQGVVSVWIREVALPVMGSVAGLSMAFTMAFGLVYVLGRLSKMQPNFERKVRGKDEYKTYPNIKFYTTLASMILLLGISLALLSPFELVGISKRNSLFDVLGEQWAGWWSLGRVAAADIALAAIALVHGAGAPATAQQTSKPQSEGEQPAKGRSAKKSKRSATAEKSQAKIPCRYAGAGCEKVGTQNAMNAHARYCEFKPTVSMPEEVKASQKR